MSMKAEYGMLTSERPAPQDNNHFLAELSHSDLAVLRPYLTTVALREGEYLFHYQDQMERVIFPCSGLVALSGYSIEGSRPLLGLAGREAIIGVIAAVRAMPAICDAQVVLTGTALAMPAAAFAQIYERDASIRAQLGWFEGAILAQVHSMAMCHASHAVPARLCRVLLEIQDRIGMDAVPLTQAALAQMLSVRRTTVTLIAGLLESQGVLRCRRGSFEIVNRGELERHACACHAELRSYLSVLFPRRSGGGRASYRYAGRLI